MINFLICLPFSETSDDEEADDGEGMTEIRFSPDDKANLQIMFSSMTHCQTLHPDPEGAENAEDEEDEEEEEYGEEDADDNGMYDDADEVDRNGDNNGEPMEES